MKESGPRVHLYEDVAAHILEQIRAGSLLPGEKAPSLRGLSRRLSVSINTVSQAYAMLEDQQILQARPKSGYYVTAQAEPETKPVHPPVAKPRVRTLRADNAIRQLLEDSQQAGVRALGVAIPHGHILPTKALARTLKNVMARHPLEVVSDAPLAGHLPLRQQIAKRLSSLGKAVTVDDVLITNGATEALMLAFRSTVKPGDIVAVASPGYFMTLQMLEVLNNPVIELPCDPQTGLDLDALESVLSEHPVRALLLNCNFDNPTGSLMPLQHKRRLLALARRFDLMIIEDDIYGELDHAGGRPLPVSALDEDERVIHCGSFSKTLAPGYRIGWLLGARHHEAAIRLKQLSSYTAPTLIQMTLAAFLDSGQYERHLKRLRRDFARQTTAMRQAVLRHFPEGTRVNDPQGGFSVWVQLPRGINTLELYSRAMDEKISFTPGPVFSATRRYTNYLRLCATQPRSNDGDAAIARLGELVFAMLAGNTQRNTP